MRWLSLGMICACASRKSTREANALLQKSGITNLFCSRLDSFSFIVHGNCDGKYGSVGEDTVKKLGDIFQEVRPWSINVRPRYEYDYIVVGVPLHLWRDETFTSIGRCIGVVKKCEYQLNSFQYVRLTIETNVAPLMQSRVVLVHGERRYEVTLMIEGDGEEEVDERDTFLMAYTDPSKLGGVGASGGHGRGDQEENTLELSNSEEEQRDLIDSALGDLTVGDAGGMHGKEERIGEEDSGIVSPVSIDARSSQGCINNLNDEDSGNNICRALVLYTGRAKNQKECGKVGELQMQYSFGSYGENPNEIREIRELEVEEKGGERGAGKEHEEGMGAGEYSDNMEEENVVGLKEVSVERENEVEKNMEEEGDKRELMEPTDAHTSRRKKGRPPGSKNRRKEIDHIQAFRDWMIGKQVGMECNDEEAVVSVLGKASKRP